MQPQWYCWGGHNRKRCPLFTISCAYSNPRLVLTSDIAIEIRKTRFSLQHFIDSPSSSLDGLLCSWRRHFARLRDRLSSLTRTIRGLSCILRLEDWLADRSSTLKSGCSWSIEVCAWQRPLGGLHRWERHHSLYNSSLGRRRSTTRSR